MVVGVLVVKRPVGLAARLPEGVALIRGAVTVIMTVAFITLTIAKKTQPNAQRSTATVWPTFRKASGAM